MAIDFILLRDPCQHYGKHKTKSRKFEAQHLVSNCSTRLLTLIVISPLSDAVVSDWHLVHDLVLLFEGFKVGRDDCCLDAVEHMWRGKCSALNESPGWIILKLNRIVSLKEGWLLKRCQMSRSFFKKMSQYFNTAATMQLLSMHWVHFTKQAGNLAITGCFYDIFTHIDLDVTCTMWKFLWMVQLGERHRMISVLLSTYVFSHWVYLERYCVAACWNLRGSPYVQHPQNDR